MERVKILGQNNFCALARLKVGLFKLKMGLIGEIVEVLPPKSLVVMIRLKSKGAIIQLSQKVLFFLTSIDEHNTEVLCQVALEEMGLCFFKILRGRIAATAEDTLRSVKIYLGQLS
jgi:hypothetical protein